MEQYNTTSFHNPPFQEEQTNDSQNQASLLIQNPQYSHGLQSFGGSRTNLMMNMHPSMKSIAPENHTAIIQAMAGNSHSRDPSYNSQMPFDIQSLSNSDQRHLHQTGIQNEQLLEHGYDEHTNQNRFEQLSHSNLMTKIREGLYAHRSKNYQSGFGSQQMPSTGGYDSNNGMNQQQWHQTASNESLERLTNHGQETELNEVRDKQIADQDQDLNSQIMFGIRNYIQGMASRGDESGDHSFPVTNLTPNISFLQSQQMSQVSPINPIAGQIQENNLAQQLSSEEYMQLQNVIQNLGTKINAMEQQTKSLQQTIVRKDKELEKLRKYKRLNPQKQPSISKPPPRKLSQPQIELNRAKSKTRLPEKTTQTPMSHINSQQTRLFLNQQHTGMIQQKQELYYSLSSEVDQAQEYLDHIKNLEHQVAFLRKTLLETQSQLDKQIMLQPVPIHQSRLSSHQNMEIEEEKVQDLEEALQRSPNGESQNENIELLIPQSQTGQSSVTQNTVVNGDDDVPCNRCSQYCEEIKEQAKSDQMSMVTKIQDLVRRLGGGSYFEYDESTGMNSCEELARTVNAKINNLEAQISQGKTSISSLKGQVSEQSMQLTELRQEKSRLVQLNDGMNDRIAQLMSEQDVSSQEAETRFKKLKDTFKKEQDELQKGLATKTQALEDQIKSLNTQLADQKFKSQRPQMESKSLQTEKQQEGNSEKDLEFQLAQANEKLQSVQAESLNKDQMIAHLTDEITRQQQEQMQRSEQIRKQKLAEKEKIRAIITGAGSKSNQSTSEKGSPSARSEQQAIKKKHRKNSQSTSLKVNPSQEPRLNTEKSQESSPEKSKRNFFGMKK